MYQQKTMEKTLNTITGGLQKMADISLETFKFSVQNTLKNVNELKNTISSIDPGIFKLPLTKKYNCDCCPPVAECQPEYLLKINRIASSGERVVVRFVVKNEGNETRTYRIGIRALKSIEGSAAPSQPVLNKNNITLDAGSAEVILMTLDLERFQNGENYNTEIVIREREINQNIYFSILIDNNSLPVAKPLDEKKYLLHWQSWKSHFYCETPLKVTEKKYYKPF